MRYLISFLLLFAILENVLSDDSLKKRMIKAILKMKEIKQKKDIQRKLQSNSDQHLEPTIPDIPYKDTGDSNPEDTNPLGNATIVSPYKPFSTPEKSDNKNANIQILKFHGYSVQKPTGQNLHYIIGFKMYIYIVNIPIPKYVIYRLRIKHIQNEGDESVKSECTISDGDLNLVGQKIEDGVSPNYNCEAEAQNDPTDAQVAINTDVDLSYSNPNGSFTQLNFDDINFSGNSSEEATNLQQYTEEVENFEMLKPENDQENPTEGYIDPEFDSSEDSPDIISNTNKSKGNISTGAIIGIIIAAVVVLVAIGTVIICCVRRKKTKNKSTPTTNNPNTNANDTPPMDEDNSINTLSVSIKREDISIKDEKEHKSKNNNNKIKINLSTTNQYKTKIFIDPKNTMEQLIKCYFKIIKKPELFGDKNVRFLLNGNFIPQNSKQLISEYLMGDNNLFILIDDLEERIPTSITK